MLKRSFIKKLSIIFLSLFVVALLLLFPKKEDKFIIKNSVNYDYIYTLDNNDYVSKIKIALKEIDLNSKIYEIIRTLTIGSPEASTIKSGFMPVIPKDVKVNKIIVSDSNVLLDFNKDIFSNNQNDRKTLESIVFSITELDGINSVTLSVNSKPIKYLPNGDYLNDKITRNIGINKEYNILNKENIKSTIVYYPATFEDFLYYIPITKINNSKKEKVEIIIDELKSSPSYNTNIVNYLKHSTSLIDYEIADNSFILNLSEEILDDINSKNIQEEVTYAITMSIKDTYGSEDVILKVKKTRS